MEKRDASAFAEAARAKKVIALLGVLPAGKSQAENDLLAVFVESLSTHQRQAYEVVAGVKKSSDETWRMVAAAIRARHVSGDGGAFERRDLRRPDFTRVLERQHRFHPDLPPERAPNGCVPCAVLRDALDEAFGAGVTAAVRAVGL